MEEKSSGLILRTRPLTETSLIVHWLTPDLGRVAVVAKGALRAKSPFRGKLDLFHLAELSFVRSRRSELHTLREVSVRDAHLGLRQDLQLLQQAAYCTQLIEQTTETETPLPGVFQLMLDLLGFLVTHPPGPVAVFAFEIQLLAILGLQPDLMRTDLRPGTREILQQFAAADWSRLGVLRLSAAQGVELRRYLHGFLIYHLGRIPEGRATALASV
ncbi:MAG TPA: DNA repair protein RecO [Bryobacteraceae bacterium]|nr:DNA repair protein RecO [Bryobacteraceae bacterium]